MMLLGKNQFYFLELVVFKLLSSWCNTASDYDGIILVLAQTFEIIAKKIKSNNNKR